MATRAITTQKIQGNVLLAQWTGLTQASLDDGYPLELLEYSDYVVEFTGTFGVGGTIVLEGSNVGTTYYTLNDVQASAISKTAAALEQVAEAPRYVRPRVTAGDGTTNLTCTIYARRGR